MESRAPQGATVRGMVEMIALCATLAFQEGFTTLLHDSNNV